MHQSSAALSGAASPTETTQHELPIGGLEPSCLLTLRDESTILMRARQKTSLANSAMLFEAFPATELDANRLRLALRPAPWPEGPLHAPCHKNAFGLCHLP